MSADSGHYGVGETGEGLESPAIERVANAEASEVLARGGTVVGAGTVLCSFGGACGVSTGHSVAIDIIHISLIASIYKAWVPIVVRLGVSLPLSSNKCAPETRTARSRTTTRPLGWHLT